MSLSMEIKFGRQSKKSKGERQSCSEIKLYSYNDRLMHLDLPSLRYGRLRGDMIMVYKLVNGLVDIDCETFFTRTKTDRTRHSEHKLFIKYSKTATRHNTFSNRAALLWNNLGENTKSAQTVTGFEQLLDKDLHFSIYTSTNTISIPYVGFLFRPGLGCQCSLTHLLDGKIR